MEKAMLNPSYLPVLSQRNRLRLSLSLLITCFGIVSGRADDTADIASAKSLSRAFRAVAKRIMPSVVKIKTTSRLRTLHANPIASDNTRPPASPFENYSGDSEPGAPAEGTKRQGLASGVIVDARGFILTNYHVIAGADEVLVELSDGKQIRAEEIRSDEQSDLAVLKIKTDRKLPAATMGDSDKLEIGDWVLAIGHPFDLDLTVSSGILSGKARILPTGRRVDYLQTDAAINPGNSGGPLVNLDGEVVGINTAIASNSGGYQGVGFAIPANLVKWVTGQLIEKGTVQRGYLGVQIEEIRADKAEELGIEPGQSVLVGKVFPDSPAAKAGLRKDDRILKFAGREVHNPRQLQEIVEQTESGASESAEVVRDGKPLTIHIVPIPLPRSYGLAGAVLREPKSADGSHLDELGLRIADPTKADIDRFGYTGSKGAMIMEVEPNGPAARAGIRPGSLVLQVEKLVVSSAGEFRLAMKARSLDKGVMLLIRTPDGGSRLVQLKTP
jgi:serine protease Do